MESLKDNEIRSFLERKQNIPPDSFGFAAAEEMADIMNSFSEEAGWNERNMFALTGYKLDGDESCLGGIRKETLQYMWDLMQKGVTFDGTDSDRVQRGHDLITKVFDPTFLCSRLNGLSGSVDDHRDVIATMSKVVEDHALPLVYLPENMREINVGTDGLRRLFSLAVKYYRDAGFGNIAVEVVASRLGISNTEYYKAMSTGIINIIFLERLLGFDRPDVYWS